MSEMQSKREVVLNSYLLGTSQEITPEWFIYAMVWGEYMLLHVCRHQFWQDAMTEPGASVASIHYLGAFDGKCRCDKPVPKKVRNTYRMATLGNKHG